MNEIPFPLAAWRDAVPLKITSTQVHRSVIESAGALSLYEWRGGIRAEAHFDSAPSAIAAIGSGALALRPSREPKRPQPAGPPLGCEPFWRY